MDLLLFTAVGRGPSSAGTLGGRFQLSVEGGAPLVPSSTDSNFAVFSLPDAPRPLALRLDVTPSSPTVHAVTAHFEYRGSGNLVIVPGPDLQAPTDPAEMLPPRAARVAQGNVVLVSIFLSRIRDATAETLSLLGTVPAPRQSSFQAPTSWNVPAANVHFVGSPPVAGGSIVTALQSVDPKAEVRILELKLPAAKDAPHFLAVAWPTDLTRTLSSGPTPLVVYFHAGMAQNAGNTYERAGTGTYPRGWDYLFFGLWRYLQYMGDPILGGDAPFSKGLPYQIAAAGKKAVVVLPLSSVATEVGVLLRAESMQEALLEVQSYMFRREGVFVFPALGRTALGSFSSGNHLVNAFLSNNQGHPFCQQILKEVYMFDAPGSAINLWVDQVTTWMGSGDSPSKVARAYVQTLSSKLANFVPAAALNRAPTVGSSADGRRTVAVLPNVAWGRAVASAGGSPSQDSFQEAHQLISAVMLTDALRRSSF